MIRGRALRELLLAAPARDRSDRLDALLGLEGHVADADDLPRGAVPYLPCGVDEILAFADEAPVTAADMLVDLGAGLGRVALLVHLLTGARACGIEIQGHLVQQARARADALRLPDVTFVHGDASALDLDGSVFFLYAPCNGAMLAALVRRIEAVARRRRVVIGAVDVELHEPFLLPRASTLPSLSLYDSR